MSVRHPPCFFGEILFDVFPDGREVLGGAPFNVAWHLQGFGLAPLLISRVGADAAGERIRAAMAAWGMRLDGLQTDPVHPTGRVTVSLRDGEPSFDIVTDSAWDFIAADELPDLTPALVYHGSLALRHPVSAAALEALLARCGVSLAGQPPGPATGQPGGSVAGRSRGPAATRPPAEPPGQPGPGSGTRPLRFVDVNLRAPWWQAEVVQGLLVGADWAKLNQDELAWLMPAPGLDPTPTPTPTSAPAPAPAPAPDPARRLASGPGRPGEPEGAISPGAAGPVPAVSGLSPLGATERDIARAAEAFRARHGLRGLVLTRGAAGALGLVAGGGIARVSPQPTHLVDAVGAGDAFAAVTLLGLLHHWPLSLTLDRAQTFASRIVQLRGATAPDPSLYQDLRLAWGLGDGRQG
jgi:fructokinase